MLFGIMFGLLSAAGIARAVSIYRRLPGASSRYRLAFSAFVLLLLSLCCGFISAMSLLPLVSG
jgi:multisubunit Na+/H+ antiporter MnhG subunit